MRLFNPKHISPKTYASIFLSYGFVKDLNKTQKPRKIGEIGGKRQDNKTDRITGERSGAISGRV